MGVYKPLIEDVIRRIRRDARTVGAAELRRLCDYISELELEIAQHKDELSKQASNACDHCGEDIGDRCHRCIARGV